MEGCENIRDGPPPWDMRGIKRQQKMACGRGREKEKERERETREREGWRILEHALKAQQELKCHSVYTCLHVSSPHCVSVCVHIVCVSATSTHAQPLCACVLVRDRTIPAGIMPAQKK